MFYEEQFSNIQNDKIFVSLGNYCLTSMILKKYGLKNESYPFDWMISKMDNIIEIIKDDFKEFLNKKNYTLIGKGTKNNIYYSNTNKLFNYKIISCDHQHHNLLEDKDYQYISRCVERFRNLKYKNKQIIFLMIQPSFHSNLNINKQQCQDLYDILLNKFGSNIKLKIFNLKTMNNYKYNEIKINENTVIYELISKLYIGECGMVWYCKRGLKKFLDIINN